MVKNFDWPGERERLATGWSKSYACVYGTHLNFNILTIFIENYNQPIKEFTNKKQQPSKKQR